MPRLDPGAPGLPPESALAYIEDMLGELAVLARSLPDPGLAAAIDLAAVVAEESERRRKRAEETGAEDAA